MNLGREEDDPDRAALLADFLADLEAVDPGHHDVQQADVKIAAVLIKDAQRLVAVGHIHHLIAGAAQVDYNKIADYVLVFRNQNSFHKNRPFILG